MSYAIEHFADHTYIVIVIEGVITVGDFVAMMEEIVNASEYPANINAIYDLTRMSFDNITTDFLLQLKVKSAKYAARRAGAKTAYVCPNDLQFGMARVWEVFLDEIPIDTKVTRTMDEALQWIVA